MQSNIEELKKQINYFFHNTYLTYYPIEMHDMLIHLFNDGKRLRPILFIAFNDINSLGNIEINNENDNIWMKYAIEIELIHCLSLVIDDLPEMDNEVERRGKTCFHVKYGLEKTNFFLQQMFRAATAGIDTTPHVM
jgi:geranylgeranyl pyrophosphate synthase